MIQKKYLFLLLLLLLIVSNSCTSKQIENELHGSWYIFRTRIEGDPCVFYNNFTSNFMEIERNGHIVFPAFHLDNDTDTIRDKQGRWTMFFSAGKTYFEIYSEDSVFSGLFRMKFLYNSHNKRLFLELTSKEIYVLAVRTPLNDIDIFNPTKQNSRENRFKEVVRLSGGDFVDYDNAPFDTCPDFDKKPRVFL